MTTLPPRPPETAPETTAEAPPGASPAPVAAGASPEPEIQPRRKRRRVAVLLFDGVEVLDFAGPFEVFSVTAAEEEEGKAPFEVYTVAAEAGPVLATGGLSINPTATFEDCPKPDVVLVPGGAGAREAMDDDRLLGWLLKVYSKAELVISICSGSLILAKAELLAGLKATTHHLVLDDLKRYAPEAELCPGERFTDNGKVLTAAGISAGLDVSLHAVERLLGRERAEATARYMEYHWRR